MYICFPVDILFHGELKVCLQFSEESNFKCFPPIFRVLNTNLHVATFLNDVFVCCHGNGLFSVK